MKPLEAGEGDRDKKIKRLIREYIAFFENVWITCPEAIKWHRMKEHFSQELYFNNIDLD